MPSKVINSNKNTCHHLVCSPSVRTGDSQIVSHHHYRMECNRHSTTLIPVHHHNLVILSALLDRLLSVERLRLDERSCDLLLDLRDLSADRLLPLALSLDLLLLLSRERLRLPLDLDLLLSLDRDRLLLLPLDRDLDLLLSLDLDLLLPREVLLERDSRLLLDFRSERKGVLKCRERVRGVIQTYLHQKITSRTQ